MKKIKETIDEMVNILNKWSRHYYEYDSPIVSDAEYDGLYNTLVKLEKRHPKLIRSDSPTQKVGGKTDNRFKKVAHNFPMLSLSNAFNNDDLIKFDKQIKDKLILNEEIEYILEYKIDGVSISLRYNNGLLVKAITRGNGEIGEDVTHNVFEIKSIPKKIDFKKEIEIRGEVFMSNPVFNKLNSDGQKLANPRNAAAGSLRQLNSEIARSRNLDAFLYQIPNPKEFGFNTQQETLDFLKFQGFKVNNKTKIVGNIEMLVSTLKLMEKERDTLDYEVDGIVVKVNNIHFYEKIGFTVKAPKYMIAYKFPEEVVKTKLKKIFATIGRTGRITYNAELLPIRLAGTTVSAATLHNADYITNKNISEGDIVLVKKAGEIIPKVMGVFKKNNLKKWIEEKFCPSCSSHLERTHGEIDQYCINENCPAKKQAKFEHFVSRSAMNIDGVSSEILKTFIEEGFITDLSSIYKLENFRKQLISLPGFKDKSINNILNSIEKSKNQDLSKFLFGLGIRHLGEKNSKLLVNEFLTINNIIKASAEQIENVKDLGPKVAQSIKNYFKNEGNINQIKEFISLGLKFNSKNIKTSKIFDRKTFVITGKLSKSRNYFQDFIENNGGNVSNSVSKKTDYLLTGESGGSKMKKAKILNINIIDEETFYKILRENSNG